MRKLIQKALAWIMLWFYSIKASRIELIGNWREDLIKCPSQCYFEFKHEDRPYVIYLRWRWDDPWTMDIVENTELRMCDDLNRWTSIPVEFYTHDQLDFLKNEAMIKTQLFLAGFYDRGIMREAVQILEARIMRDYENRH
jgi:hypothetical protein